MTDENNIPHEPTVEEVAPQPSEADVLREEMQRLQEQLEAAEAGNAELNDKFLRSQAELANYRRRVSADIDRARAAGVDSTILTVVKVFDDLARAIESVSPDADGASVLDGVKLVLSNLEADLGAIGIVREGNVGEQFDPEKHDAVTAVPADAGHPAGTIAQVLRTGFSQGERLIRPATVVVYND